MEPITIKDPVAFDELLGFVFKGPGARSVVLPPAWAKSVERSHQAFLARLESGEPIYGVTTGFGDSCFRRVDVERSEKLQDNLIQYLTCGTGPILRRPVRRAICFFRLLSLARGLSGVSPELIHRMTDFVEADWLPLIPAEGSLGASGDLVPLAYLAQAIQGRGEIETPEGIFDASRLLVETGRTPYRLKPKEGLALVNGTSAMVGQAYVNVVEAEALFELSVLETAWLCLVLHGRNEPFGRLVNERAKNFSGQKESARKIRELLEAEGYSAPPLTSADAEKEIEIQDRYSMRCAPQVLGPVLDTINLVKSWVETEINGVSDNPLVELEEGRLHSGGNFYGGYLSHGMDYLKIAMAQSADLLDRQIAYLIDEKSNRGLPPNLANWPNLAPEERSLHHGLKGLHQAISAVTSETLARSFPVGVFSRSTESHNQDKVSLGMSAAMSAETQIDALFRIHAMALICLAQAIDLRAIRLKGQQSSNWYDRIRNISPFVEKDRPLDKDIRNLTEVLRQKAVERESL